MIFSPANICAIQCMFVVVNLLNNFNQSVLYTQLAAYQFHIMVLSFPHALINTRVFMDAYHAISNLIGRNWLSTEYPLIRELNLKHTLELAVHN